MDQQEPEVSRKLYEPPRVLESGSFERLVLACVKTGSSQCDGFGDPELEANGNS